jgi:rubredoxin
MENYKCNLCNYIFNSKFSLERHQNKKKKCDIVTEYKCSKCNKCFTQRKNLLHHIKSDICKINNIETENKLEVNDMKNDNKKAIQQIIESNMTNEKKISMIKLLNSNLKDENIIEILNNELPIETKIILLNNAKIFITTINNTTNNTNNIQINNFGSENLDYIHNGYLKKLITSIKTDQNIGGEYLFLKLSNKIYLNDKHPENNTIKIDNLKNDFCKIKNNNKWIISTKDDALKNIFDKICTIVKYCIDENKELISERVFEKIDGYIEKDFTDEIAKSSIKKLAIDIYNYYNATDI